MGQMIAQSNTVYKNGKWGQFDSQGRQQFDCVCAIKAYGWEVPLGVDITRNQYSYIANNKTEVPDETIGSIYAKASRKSTNMSTVPTDRPYLVYMGNSHIGVAYHGRVREMCAGSVMNARETDLTAQSWNKWSDLYWAEDSIDAPAPKEPELFRVQVGSFLVKANAIKRAKELISKGFNACLKLYDGNYRVQVGAYSVKKNADNMQKKIKAAGYSCYVTTESGVDVELK